MLVCVSSRLVIPPPTDTGTIADFVNDVYSFNGETRTFADFFDAAATTGSNGGVLTPFGLVIAPNDVTDIIGELAASLVTMDFLVRIRFTTVNPEDLTNLLRLFFNDSEYGTLATAAAALVATDAATGFDNRVVTDSEVAPALTPGNHTVVWSRSESRSALARDGYEAAADFTNQPTVNQNLVFFESDGSDDYVIVRSIEILEQTSSLETISLLSAETEPTAAPENDDFADSITVTADETVYGTTFEATTEVGEPVYPGFPGECSVWYDFTAPSSGDFRLDLRGDATTIDDFFILITVFTGSSVGSLSTVVRNEVEVEGGFYVVEWAATMGTVYRISIDVTGGGRGTFQLEVTEV